MNATTKTPLVVTEEQLDRCHRIIDEATGQVFYRVESESDPDTEYTVRAIRKDSKWHTTCSCPAGQHGTPCKHRRWATAHADWFKAEQAALAERDAEATQKAAKLAKIRRLVEMGLTHAQAAEIADGYSDLDEATLARVYAVPVRKSPKPRDDNKVFSLMR
jgi:hypothetical protein